MKEGNVQKRRHHLNRLLIRATAGCFLFGFLLFGSRPVIAQAPLHLIDKNTTVSAISFKFVDSQTFEDSRLKEQLATLEPVFVDKLKRLIPFVGNRRVYPFNPIELQRDVARLRRYYRQNGFLRSTISYPASQLNTEKNKIHVIFTVNEGPPLTIQNVGFYTPDLNPATDFFVGALHTKWVKFLDRHTFQTGTRYTEFEAIRIQDRVLTWLNDEGFAFSDVDTQASIDSTLNTVDLRYIIDPGPQGYFSEILVEGNESVSDDVLLRQLPFELGDRFSGKEISRGQQELFALNLFRIALTDVPAQPRDSTVTVRYRVSEARHRHISAQTGFAQEAGFTLQADWSHRNFLGGARQLTISGVLNSGIGPFKPEYERTKSVNTSISLWQPYLFLTHLSATFAPFYNRENNWKQNLAFQELGTNTSLLYKIYQFRTVSLQYTFSRVFPLEATGFSSLQPIFTEQDIYNRSVLSLSATFGRTNNYLNPWRGFLFHPFIEAAGEIIASDVSYYKLSNEAIGYLPITRKIQLSGRLFLGTIQLFGESRDQENLNTELRFDRIRFYAGGSSDVRGWSNDLLGPKRLLADTLRNETGQVTLDQDGNPVIETRYEAEGGLSKVGGNLELRLPFPGLSRAWGTALFFDAAKLYSKTDAAALVEGNAGVFRYGVGGGLRYETLVGHIRLDVGYKVNPSLTDLHRADELYPVIQGDMDESELPARFWRRFKIHLSIGQTF